MKILLKIALATAAALAVGGCASQDFGQSDSRSSLDLSTPPRSCAETQDPPQGAAREPLRRACDGGAAAPLPRLFPRRREMRQGRRAAWKSFGSAVFWALAGGVIGNVTAPATERVLNWFEEYRCPAQGALDRGRALRREAIGRRSAALHAAANAAFRASRGVRARRGPVLPRASRLPRRMGRGVRSAARLGVDA